MSEEIVDVRIRAREEVIRTLKEVNQEIQRTGRMTEETREAFQRSRKEIVEQNRALKTLGLAYREQHQTLELAATAFQDVASMVGKAQRMYEQYNVAMIRQTQLQNAAQEAQRKYNEAVAKFGPHSSEAVRALKELENAQNAVANAQKQNTLMLVGFVAQLPSMLTAVLKLQVDLAKLKSHLDLAALSAYGLRAALYGVEVAVGVLSGVAMVKLLEAFGGPLARKALQDWAKLLNDIRNSLSGVQEEAKQTTEVTEKTVTEMVAEVRVTKQQQEALRDLTRRYQEGNITIQDFAQGLRDLGLEGKTIVQTLTNTVVQVPKTFQEQLVGRAQASLESFKNCVTGKFYDVKVASAEKIQGLVTDTNNLIKAGLLGQAQDNIQAFATCSTNKQKKMVEDIDGYLKNLRDEYAANEKKIAELTTAGKDAEVAIWKARQKEIMAIISQLEDWKKRIISQPWTAPANVPGVPGTPPIMPGQPCPFCGATGGNHQSWCPVLSNEWYGFQQGGIVTRPTLALLGERGPEAVVPLREGARGPMRTDVNVSVSISSLHVSNEQQVQEFFDRLQRKIVTALR